MVANDVELRAVPPRLGDRFLERVRLQDFYAFTIQCAFELRARPVGVRDQHAELLGVSRRTCARRQHLRCHLPPRLKRLAVYAFDPERLVQCHPPTPSPPQRERPGRGFAPVLAARDVRRARARRGARITGASLLRFQSTYSRAVAETRASPLRRRKQYAADRLFRALRDFRGSTRADRLEIPYGETRESRHIARNQEGGWSGRRDLNSRPPAPHGGRSSVSPRIAALY